MTMSALQREVETHIVALKGSSASREQNNLFWSSWQQCLFHFLPTQTIFMCFMWIWEQTAIISLYSINWLVFITETECLLRGTDWVFIYNSTFCPHSVFMFCMDMRTKSNYFPTQHQLIGFCNRAERVYCAVRHEYLIMFQPKSPVSIPGQSIWYSWWTKWQRDSFPSSTCALVSQYHSTNDPYSSFTWHRRTRGRILEILKERNILSKITEHWIETYFPLLFGKVKHGGNKRTFYLPPRQTD